MAGQILQRKIDFAFEVDEIKVDGIASMKFGSEEVILAVPVSFAINETLRDHCFCPGNMSNGIHGIYETKPIGQERFVRSPLSFSVRVTTAIPEE